MGWLKWIINTLHLYSVLPCDKPVISKVTVIELKLTENLVYKFSWLPWWNCHIYLLLYYMRCECYILGKWLETVLVQTILNALEHSEIQGLVYSLGQKIRQICRLEHYVLIETYQCDVLWLVVIISVLRPNF